MTQPTHNILQPKNILVKPPKVEVLDMAFGNEGDVVLWKIGNNHLRISYRDAFFISSQLRRNAKACKRRVGDFDNHWSVYGELEAVR